MPKDKLTRTSIPKSLLNAKNSAVAEFLLPDTDERPMAFAARTNPKHNVVSVGLGRKIVQGKLTAQHCVRLYVEQKIPEKVVPNEFMLPGKIKGIPTDVIETIPSMCGCSQGTLSHSPGAPRMLGRVFVQWQGHWNRDGRHVRRGG